MFYYSILLQDKEIFEWYMAKKQHTFYAPSSCLIMWLDSFRMFALIREDLHAFIEEAMRNKDSEQKHRKPINSSSILLRERFCFVKISH